MPKYRKSRPRYWRRTGNVLTDHIVCPKCGENADDQKRDRGSVPKLSCTCKEGKCFDIDGENLVWRRSPCPNAECKTCGWKGKLRSRDFEQVYSKSRCPLSDNGWHDVAVKVYKNEIPGPLTIELRCKACGAMGHKTIDAVVGIAWSEPEGSNDGQVQSRE